MNTKKILGLIVLIAIVVLAFGFNKNKAVAPDLSQIQPAIMGNAGDLVSLSINAGDSVSGNTVITGSVKNAYFFEANIIVKVTDISNNLLLTTYGTATTDWMTTAPVSFTSNVDFTGLPVGPAYLVLENDNPSGDPALLKQIMIPIVIN